ncbi:hotdog fold thioesterase [Nocardia sp. R6R-6]|uniref:hotdog fold thioesterase n=1 Tax=Nocardia sp. R6R-6 TaxID=3459303 RepID=UPI00403DBA14
MSCPKSVYGGLPTSDGEFLTDLSPDCKPGAVERRFGVVGCRADGSLLRSVMLTGPWMNDSAGRAQVGALGVLLDHVLGEVFYVARAADKWSLTTELSLDVIVPPPWTTTAVHAISWAPQEDRTSGFAQCEVRDDAGILIAVGTTRVQYVAASQALNGTQNMAEFGSGAANFAEHMGLRIASDADAVRVELTDPRRWHNVYGILHGGVWAGLAEAAAAEVFARHGCLRTARLQVAYLRPPARGAAVRVEARPVHVGRLFGLIEVTGLDSTGRQCVRAVVTGRQYES